MSDLRDGDRRSRDVGRRHLRAEEVAQFTVEWRAARAVATQSLMGDRVVGAGVVIELIAANHGTGCGVQISPVSLAGPGMAATCTGGLGLDDVPRDLRLHW